ncbi:hypothetical protein [uncultured Ruegeria sp.]|uniref:hypothetical protein n=1 Tax=uncultured Ruegeria sp. TaxID=259304 RepID=UPI00260CCB05|nr:hypothetical protein [uncultured Ruegeria sp.]
MLTRTFLRPTRPGFHSGTQARDTTRPQAQGNRRRMRHPRRKRRGSLIGGMLYLLVITVVIIGLYGLYNGMMNMLRSNQLQSQLTRAVAIIERYHSYTGIYANESLLGFLDGEGFTDQEFAETAAGGFNFRSPYGTDITIQGDERNFIVTINDLPDSACKKAALAFQSSGSGLDGLVIENTPVVLPMTEIAVNGACNNGTNDVALTF